MNQGLFGLPVPHAASVPYIHIQDRKTQFIEGGTFTSGADRTRDLNTIVTDSAGIARLIANQIILPAGTYTVCARCPALGVAENVAWLYNVTDAILLVPGQNNYADHTSFGFCYALVEGRFVLNATKTLEVRHRCGATQATNGFGSPVASLFTVANEIYTDVEIWKNG